MNVLRDTNVIGFIQKHNFQCLSYNLNFFISSRIGTNMSTQFITNYRFGRITINGESYSNDVILLGEEVRSNWWRDRGHSLSLNDLEAVIQYDPEMLIVGTGNSGRMSVPRSLPKQLDMEVKSYKTDKAVQKYNELLKEGKKVAGAFHLTC